MAHVRHKIIIKEIHVHYNLEQRLDLSDLTST